MRTNLINDLKNLAQKILQLKDGDNTENLRKNVLIIYEKLTVLEFLNENIKSVSEEKNSSVNLKDSTIDDIEPNIDVPFENTEEDIIDEEIHKLSFESLKDEVSNEIEKNEIDEQIEDLEDLFVPTFDSIKEDMSQKEEFKDTISLEETEKMFETKKEEAKQLSLNDKLLSSNIQIGLNDRIAFVNQLFNYSQSDFNTVLSGLNSYTNKNDALKYIEYTVKPKYNWKGKEELEERLIFIIERKFL